MVRDAGYDQLLRDIFPSLGSIRTAMGEDLDAAVREKGWRRPSMSEVGLTYDTFFTPAIDAILRLARGDDTLCYWSGPTGPTPPTALRESPLDGDAFRES